MLRPDWYIGAEIFWDPVMAWDEKEDDDPGPIPSHPTKITPIKITNKLQCHAQHRQFSFYLSVASDITDHFFILETFFS